MPDRPNQPLDLASIRARLAGENGPRFWSSLDELAGTEQFRDFLHREFPREASVWENDEPGRRGFLKVMGASLALAGLTACTKQPDELILPYVKKPEEIIPGRPLYFATAFTMNGAAEGVLVESHQGRPTKIEGNPEHPSSLGAANLFAQASVLGLYDPDRSQTVMKFGSISDFPSLKAEVLGLAQSLKATQGAGLRFLSETVVSPTMRAAVEQLLRDYPQAKWVQYEPAGPHGARAGAKLAFGEPAAVQYDVAAAKVILSLDSDFLTNGVGAVKYARAFADARRVRHDHTEMGRMYAVESAPTNTGAKADHRWPAKASDIAGIAAGIAKALGVEAGPIVPSTAPYIAAIAADLKANAGASLVVAGDGQPASVHALALAMNAALGNFGKTVATFEPAELNAGADQFEQLADLTKEMAAGKVETLFVFGGNPIYNAPADIGFREAFSKVKTRIHLGPYNDETGELCHWHVPEAHYLETWGDTRSLDGTASIQQPLIAPLYRGKSPLEILALFTAEPEKTGHELVRAHWQGRTKLAEGPFDDWWRKAVHDGLIAQTSTPKAAAVKAGWSAGVKALTGSGTEIIFRADLGVHDGRFANNGWLQELPKPITKITWDNPILISVAMGESQGLANGDIIEVAYGGRKITGPVWLQPGHPNESITVILGYGRTRAGRVATGVGYNAYALRTSATPLFGLGASIRKTGDHHDLATTQEHWRMESPEKLGGAKRYLVRIGTLDEYKKDPKFVHEMEETPPRELTLYSDQHKYNGNAWGMVIDLTACNGCNACVIACHAENNIPVVGRDQVLRGREMHWLRIDRYYEGNLDNPKPYHQPILCMQCENAPCEVVCPVAATTHSQEGLNDMTYNRCVGTRYCSHNCPYKVRRFNFLLYSDFTTETIAMQKNPDVSVRSRGVMEKCTYCTQRIAEVRILSERENRPVRDGEIKTACEQTCPTQAITFGNINDPESRVAKLKKEHLNYGLLEDLNTRPRTTYLAYLRNPNPSLEKES